MDSKIAVWGCLAIDVLVAVAIMAACSLLVGLVVMVCWNYVMPYISNGVLPEIGFWRAFALSVLVNTMMGKVPSRWKESKQ